MPTIAPSDRCELFHIRHPFAGTTGTLNQSIRIDAGKYDYLLVLVSAAGIATADMVLTPVMYDAPTGGTGVRMDGTGGQPDLRITYDFDAPDDNKASATEIRCALLPKPWLGFEQVLGGTTTYAMIVLGFISIESAASTNFKAPLAAATAKQGSAGFS